MWFDCRPVAAQKLVSEGIKSVAGMHIDQSLNVLTCDY